jgi:hypothetical protein
MGQKLAAYDGAGKIIAFYDSEDSPAPVGATTLEITDVQWQQCQGTPGYTVANGELAPPTAPTSAQLLASAQAAQMATIMSAYQAAISDPVSFTTSGGMTKAFQADPDSQTILMAATQGYTLAGAVPSGFYWVSADNAEVPFTLADLSGLYAATLAQGWSAFQKKQTLKAQIAAATTVATVQAITW